MPTPPAAEARPRVVLVTGPSGAGRSTAIAALEDLGFEAIDNMPLSLLAGLLGAGAGRGGRPLALGLDARNRDFAGGGLIAAVEALHARPDLDVETLYLDCRAEVLLRRYSETRRRHPMAPSGDPAEGVAAEAALLAGLRERAGALIDTSAMTPHELRAEISRAFGPLERDGADGPAVTLVSFSYRRGVPLGVETALDCRLLRNPHWEPRLRVRDGTEDEVAAYVAADPRHAPFLEAALTLLRLMLAAQGSEARAHLSVGLGCTGGQHRSVAVAEALARALAADGAQVSIRHRELERRAAAGSPRMRSEGAADGRPHGPAARGAGPGDGSQGAGSGPVPGSGGRGRGAA